MAAIYLAWRLGLRALVMMSLDKVLDGWIETCRKFIPNFKVWIVDSRSECPEDVDVILCMDGRFKHIPEAIIPTIGTLIVDESHLLCTPTRIDTFLSIFPKYVILLSATNKKKNGFHKIGECMAGTHGVFRISKEPYDIYIVDTNVMGEEERGESGVIFARLQQNLVSNHFRQDVVLNLLMLNCEHHKIMCLRAVKESIPEFVQRVRDCGITCDSMFGRKGTYENSQVLIGTRQKMGTGFDESNSCMDFYKNPVRSNMMIFEFTTPDADIFEQNRGRVMRSAHDEIPRKPVVIILRDNNRSSHRHIEELKPWFKETNGTVRTINYWDLFLPLKIKTFKRPVIKQVFYRVLNNTEYENFQEFRILDPRKSDFELGGYQLFDKEEDVLKTKQKGYVLTLSSLNVAERIIDGVKEFIATCPICYFHVQEISFL